MGPSAYNGGSMHLTNPMAPAGKTTHLVLPAIGTLLLVALALLLWHRGAPPGTWIASWQLQTPFTIARRGLAAAATRSHVYVVGGMDNDNHYVAQTEYAAILPDGRLDRWQLTSSLNEPRFYLAAVVAGDYLYAIGGANGARGQDNVPTATVERAAIRSDGSLDPWQRVSYLTVPRRGLQTAVYRNHIYAIGGYDGEFLKSVELADIGANNSLSGWHLDPEHAVVDRYIHSATSWNDRLYLLGGHEQNSEVISYGDVEMTRIGTDGRLEPWRIQPSVLETPRFIAAAFALGRHIYMLGGHNGRNRLRSVEMAPLDPGGRVGTWSFTTPLVEARSATALAVANGRVYVMGGMGTGGALNSVEMAEQNRNGQLGHYQ